jgi:hypothetical protein
VFGRPFSHNGPGDQRATRDGSNRSRETGRVTGSELTGSNRFVEQRFVTGMQTPRVLDGKSVEIWIADIELKEGQTVRQLLGGLDLPRHFGRRRHHRGERRAMRCAHIGEARIDTIDPHFHERQ